MDAPNGPLEFPVLRSGTHFVERRVLSWWDAGRTLPMVVEVELMGRHFGESPVCAVKYARASIATMLTELVHNVMCSLFPHRGVLSCYPAVCVSTDQRVGLVMPLGAPLAKLGELCDVIALRPADAAVVVLRDVFHGLSFLHSIGVTHGDLHVGNVLWSNGHWRLFDFGHSSSEKTALKTANRTMWGGRTPLTRDEELNNNRDALQAFIYQVQQCARDPSAADVDRLVEYVRQAESVSALGLLRVLGVESPSLVADGYDALAWRCFVAEELPPLDAVPDDLVCARHGVTQSTILHLALQASQDLANVLCVLDRIERLPAGRSVQVVNARDVFGLAPLMILACFPDDRDAGGDWARTEQRLLALGADRNAVTVFPGLPNLSFRLIDVAVRAGQVEAILHEQGESDFKRIALVMELLHKALQDNVISQDDLRTLVVLLLQGGSHRPTTKADVSNSDRRAYVGCNFRTQDWDDDSVSPPSELE